MKSDTSLSAEALLAERSRLENLLDVSEDWRALRQLRSRAARGEGLSAIDAANLEAMLIQALADNPFYGPYRSVCLAIDRLSGSSEKTAKPGAQSNAPPTDGRDNFTRIRGVSAALAQRLADKGITTFAEIAEWRAADIQRVSSDLQLGKQIYAQNWIEQAALLAATSPNKAPTKAPDNAPQKIAPAPAPADTPSEKSAAPAKPAATVPSQPREATDVPQLAGGAAPAVQLALPVDVPEPDPNQLTLDFSRKAARPIAPPAAPAPPPAAAAPAKPAQISSAPAAPRAATPLTAGPMPVAHSVMPPPLQNALSAPAVPPSSPPVDAGSAPTAKAVPVAAAVSTRPIGPPPRPILPRHYGLATPETATPASPKPAPPSVLDPLVVHPPVTVVTAPKPAAALASAPSTPVMPLTAPPRPLVITRASLPRREPVDIPPLKAAAPPPLPASSPSVTGVPAMSIAEALAYAAEIAKKGQKPDQAAAALVPSTVSTPPEQTRVSQADAKPPLPDGKGAAAVSETAPKALPSVTSPAAPPPLPGIAARPPAAPQAAPKAAPPQSAPAIPSRLTPPPLPPTFKAPEPPPPPPRPQPAPRATRVEHARPTERDDFAHRANVEEASVEIVRKQPSGPATPLDPAMAAALAASNLANASVQAKSSHTQAQDPGSDKPAPRGATPIGRFLKALTGN